jgi:hypothetical protein
LFFWQNPTLSKFAQCNSTKEVLVYFSIIVNSRNKIYAEFFWPALPAKRLSITVLQFGSMELDLPTPVSHPPSQGIPERPRGIPTTKNVFASVKNEQNCVESLEKSEKEFDKLTFGNSGFVRCQN